MRIGTILLSTTFALAFPGGSRAAGTRLIDGGESALGWEDGKLGAAGVVKNIALSADPVQSGTHSIVVTLDSLDGAPDSATMTWPRQAGVQTNAIPAECVDMAQAKSVRVYLYAEPDPASGPGLLQARLYLKTGAAWLWHTTEALDGNTAFTDVYAGSWVPLESAVENFYSSQTARGIVDPGMLKSVGVQFFTWGGSWSGKIYLDQAELVDTLPETARLRPAAIGKSAWSGPAARRYDANGRRSGAKAYHFVISGN